VVDNSTGSSPREGTSNYLEMYELEPEHQRSPEMGRIVGRGSSMGAAIRRVNLGITIKWEYRRMEELLSRKTKLDSVIWIRGDQELPG
jgi:hypothetical protein